MPGRSSCCTSTANGASVALLQQKSSAPGARETSTVGTKTRRPVVILTNYGAFTSSSPGRGLVRLLVSGPAFPSSLEAGERL